MRGSLDAGLVTLEAVPLLTPNKVVTAYVIFNFLIV
jgi:hypothetical protein